MSCQTGQTTDVLRAQGLSFRQNEIVSISVRTGAKSTRVLIELVIFLYFVADQKRTKLACQTDRSPDGLSY